jgi:hypothetical protein
MPKRQRELKVFEPSEQGEEEVAVAQNKTQPVAEVPAQLQALPSHAAAPPASQTMIAAPDDVYISNCCRKDSDSQVSRGLLRFLVTSFFTLCLLAFSMYKLSGSGTSGDEKALYYSLLASCLAVYMPAPTPHDLPTGAQHATSAH